MKIQAEALSSQEIEQQQFTSHTTKIMIILTKFNICDHQMLKTKVTVFNDTNESANT